MTQRPDKNLELIRRVLGSDYLELLLKKLTFEEDFERGMSMARIETVTTQDSTPVSVEGEGVGIVDALMNGLLKRFAGEYESLKSIEFSAFAVRADFNTKEHLAGSDALGEVDLDVRNSEGQIFRFSDKSRSIVASATRAVVAAVEYFINAERAFIILHRALEDAKSRNRGDLVARYTRELSEVAESTSYAEVIERIRKKM